MDGGYGLGRPRKDVTACPLDGIHAKLGRANEQILAIEQQVQGLLSSGLYRVSWSSRSLGLVGNFSNLDFVNLFEL